MNIVPVIEQLLYKHDCVIVPEFGAFIASFLPAKINSQTQRAHPPCRILAFNSSLVNNDGLLANAIATQNKVSYPEACEIIAQATEKWFTELQAGKHLQMEHIGALYFNDFKALQFLPDSTINYLLDSYGLDTIKLRNAAVNKKIFSDETTLVSTNKKRVKWFNFKNLEAIPVAAAMLLLFVFPQVISRLNSSLSEFLLLNNDSALVSNSKNTEASINPFNTENTETLPAAPQPAVPDENRIINQTQQGEDIAAKTETVSTTTIVNMDTKPEAVVALPDKDPGTHIAKSPAPADKTKVVNEQPESKKITGFHIVAGCFMSYENAVKFRDELVNDGLKASIPGKRKGLFVVSCYHAASEKEVRSKLTEVKQHLDNNAWLMDASSIK
ncbi:MAG: hypothetical protein IPO27_17865 [Bacteroidetes bacterium]|nr:hypothetical protein [Bacteroidota bacterium]